MPRKSDEIINKKLEDSLKACIEAIIKESVEKIHKNMATKEDIKRLEQKINDTAKLQHQLDALKEWVKTLEENSLIRN